jgi:hypothetical protein
MDFVSVSWSPEPYSPGSLLNVQAVRVEKAFYNFIFDFIMEGN